jgi:HEAT repeat protein
VLSTTLYALAVIGDDRAIDFVAQVARSSKNRPLRDDAIFYLGNIGTDRARQALLKIVKGE